MLKIAKMRYFSHFSLLLLFSFVFFSLKTVCPCFFPPSYYLFYRGLGLSDSTPPPSIRTKVNRKKCISHSEREKKNSGTNSFIHGIASI